MSENYWGTKKNDTRSSGDNKCKQEEVRNKNKIEKTTQTDGANTKTKATTTDPQTVLNIGTQIYKIPDIRNIENKNKICIWKRRTIPLRRLTKII